MQKDLNNNTKRPKQQKSNYSLPNNNARGLNFFAIVGATFISFTFSSVLTKKSYHDFVHNNTIIM
jgi:hypothetical protein